MRPDLASLLDPTRAPLRLSRLDWIAVLVVYGAAWMTRAMFLDVHPYTAEAAHYVIARDLWHGTPALWNLYNPGHVDYAYLFWQRPVFSLALAPGAWGDFETYRLWHMAVTSLVPVLVLVLLRTMHVRRGFAWAAGAILVVHPFIVPWSTMVLPDALVAVLSLAGLLAAHKGRPVMMAVFLVAACWTKEVALVTVLVLAGFAALRDGPAGGRIRLMPLQLGPWTTALGLCAAAAFMPLLFSLSKPFATFPGWRVGGDDHLLLEMLFPVLWLAWLPVLGLRWTHTRRLAAVSVGWTGFFVLYHFVLGRAVEAWYLVVPVTMAVAAMAASLDALWPAQPWRASLRNAGVAVLAFAAAGLLVAQALAPDHTDGKRDVMTPWTHTGQWSLDQAVLYEHERDDRLYEVLDALGPADERLLVVDMDWSFVLYPLQHMAETVYTQDTFGTTVWRMDVGVVAHGVENRTDAVVIHHSPHALNVALRDVYADCVVLENSEYTLVRAGLCQGRAQALHDAVYGASPDDAPG